MASHCCFDLTTGIGGTRPSVNEMTSRWGVPGLRIFDSSRPLDSASAKDGARARAKQARDNREGSASVGFLGTEIIRPGDRFGDGRGGRGLWPGRGRGASVAPAAKKGTPSQTGKRARSGVRGAGVPSLVGCGGGSSPPTNHVNRPTGG
ncbi:MAG: hypothetical protein Ct9H300mP1_27370 [Planctomycetaceae bacterium]|nr:MAG: hypothetical protein Ct9H300mP1_27370 [Planctomycetaceae bacterium]